jgi:hypothetical protein
MTEAIEDLMDCFDFHKVRQAMKALDWRWASLGDVPAISELRKEARRLLRTAAEYPRDYYFVATGGFVARKEHGILSLSFEVADWSVDIA